MSTSQKRHWKRLVSSWWKNRPATTLEIARSYLATYSDDSAAWLILGDVLTDLAQYDESAKAIRKSIRLCPRNRLEMPYAQMGHLYREKGNLRVAERWYRKAVEFNSKDGNIWVFLGGVLAKQGRYSEAKRCHRRSIKLGSVESEEAHLNLGLILRAEGDYHGALKCFDEALRLDPKYVVAKESRVDLVEAMKIREKNKSHPGRYRAG